MQRLSRDRSNLWLEQRRHEKRVFGPFNRFDPSIVSAGGNSKAVPGEAIGVRR